MNFIEHYFSKILCINLDRRADRWLHCLAQFAKYGLTKVERFEAHGDVMMEGKVNGNAGCTASHRGILELICHHKWPRTLVLEDDFEMIHDDFHARFEAMLPEVPNDWDMLYLGGHYAEKPIARISPHVIRMGKMLTTSSYGITYEMARKMAPHISGIGPIDQLYGGYHHEAKCYIFQPRLIVQYTNYSDLMEQEQKNDWPMTDTYHEKMV